MLVSNNIKYAREQKKISQAKLAEVLGVKSNTVWRWENQKATPSAETLMKIAEALDTSPATLLVGGEIASPPTVDDSHVVRIPEQLVKIKVLSFAACMGSGFDNEGENVEVIDELLLPIGDVGVTGPEEPFAVEVQGQSMSPTIEDGVRVIVNPNIMPGRGEVCMARFLMRGYMRDAIKFYYPTADGGVVLKSSEKSGVPPMEFTAKELADGDVKIIGRVMSYNITVRL